LGPEIENLGGWMVGCLGGWVMAQLAKKKG